MDSLGVQDVSGQTTFNDLFTKEGISIVDDSQAGNCGYTPTNSQILTRNSPENREITTLVAP